MVGHNDFVGNFGDHITVGLLLYCCEACGQAMTATRKVHLVLGVRGGERLLVADGAGKGGAPPLQPNAHQVLVALARQRLPGNTTGWLRLSFVSAPACVPVRMPSACRLPRWCGIVTAGAVMGVQQGCVTTRYKMCCCGSAELLSSRAWRRCHALQCPTGVAFNKGLWYVHTQAVGYSGSIPAVLRRSCLRSRRPAETPLPARRPVAQSMRTPEHAGDVSVFICKI